METAKFQFHIGGIIVTSTNTNLHGNAPDKSEVALLLIDVINDLEFPDGD